MKQRWAKLPLYPTNSGRLIPEAWPAGLLPPEPETEDCGGLWSGSGLTEVGGGRVSLLSQAAWRGAAFEPEVGVVIGHVDWIVGATFFTGVWDVFPLNGLLAPGDT